MLNIFINIMSNFKISDIKFCKLILQISKKVSKTWTANCYICDSKLSDKLKVDVIRLKKELVKQVQKKMNLNEAYNNKKMENTEASIKVNALDLYFQKAGAGVLSLLPPLSTTWARLSELEWVPLREKWTENLILSIGVWGGVED